MAVKMENLHEGEKVDIVIRRHWIAFVLLWVYVISWLLLSGVLIGLTGISSATLFLAVIFWMYYSLFIYVSWLNYELDLFIFTNNRVVCIEQKSFLNRAVWETTLDKIQEVGMETKGLLANIFDYGTLSIMTAGSTPSFDMSFSPKPMQSSRYINNLVDKYRDNLYGWNKKKTAEKPQDQVQEILNNAS